MDSITVTEEYNQYVPLEILQHHNTFHPDHMNSVGENEASWSLHFADLVTPVTLMVIECGILLLLRSPAITLGFTMLGEIFAYVTIFFFHPTMEVVTFRLCGWCMLGVFLLPAFTCLGHEYQDLLSPCDGIHVCTD